MSESTQLETINLSVVRGKDIIDVPLTSKDIQDRLCPNATPKEVFMAMGICQSQNLNPFTKEVHFIKYSKESVMQIVVGYEVYLKRAERSGKLNGWKAWIDADKQEACLIIYRKDWSVPFEWYVKLTEFNKNQSTWKQIPDFMGKKVVIAQGFRMAFPDECGGMPYTKEEYDVYDITPSTDEPVTVHQAPQPKKPEGKIKPQPQAIDAEVTDPTPAPVKAEPKTVETPVNPVESQKPAVESTVGTESKMSVDQEKAIKQIKLLKKISDQALFEFAGKKFLKELSFKESSDLIMKLNSVKKG